VAENAAQTDSDLRRPVMHVINGEHYSGAERVQDLLAQRLPEFGFDVSFGCVKPASFAQMRQCRESPVYDLPMRLRFDMRPVFRLVRLMKRNGTTLLHAHTPRSLMVARAAAMVSGLPLIYHVHSPTSRDSTRPLRNWLNHASERLCLTGVDRLITVSHSLAGQMRHVGIEASRIVTVPNGVPIVSPLPNRSAPEDSWTIGTVALFRPRKGLEVLLTSLAKLKHRQIKFRLRAVGPFESEDYRLGINRLVNQLGIDTDVDFVGFTRDVHAELRQMDLFVLPSLFGEGLPMVVLEAMAAGVPVVATRVEGVPEAVRDGVDGVLAEAADADDLARAMRVVVESREQWQLFRQRGYDRHRTMFSDLRMAQQVAAVYRSVLDARSRQDGTLSRIQE
jgi:glycosyltransferase involved in cell wall biosynthesis